MTRWSALALLLAVVSALALRLPKLDTRPLHNDEAVNAIKVTELWEHGRYAYDPDEYHGPTLHYATLPFLWLSGARNADELPDATLRFAPVAFGAGLILLLLLFVDGLGRAAMAWAAIFIAVSPAMVFYSRYFIHEMLLVFFTLLTLGAGWRYVRSATSRVEERGKLPVWAAIAGAGVGLMFATKETFVITLFAMAVAGFVTAWWTKGELNGAKMFSWNWKHIGLALAAAILVWIVFFSSFFTHFAGLLDSIRTYLPWLKRAGGHSPHIHPWYFYFERLAWFHPFKGAIWSEGLILVLALIGAGVSLAGKKSALHRFVALFTIVLAAAYSVISYKTPWCLLNFYIGMILLAGVGAAWLVNVAGRRAIKVAITSLLLLLTVQLAFQSWCASFGKRVQFSSKNGAVRLVDDWRNPYVYAQTSPNILELVQRAEGIARVAPNGFGTVVKVIAPESDYWPLPWYLRRFQNVGWYDKLPDDPYAPIVIVSSKLNARLDEKSDRKWIMAGLTELRPRVFLELYVELELWKKYVATLPRPRDDE
jgi:uncharacterized protein (TIGR03663 family)